MVQGTGFCEIIVKISIFAYKDSSSEGGVQIRLLGRVRKEGSVFVTMAGN